MSGAKTALLTVDLQLSLAPGFPGAVREALRPQLEAFRAEGSPIVHALGNAALRAPTVGAAVDPTLAPRPGARLYGRWLERGYLQRLGPGEVALYKPGRGAFAGGSLEAYLRAQDVGTLLIAGVGFAQGIRSTVLEAVQRRFAVIILEDAVTEMYPLAKLEAARLGATVKGLAAPRRDFPWRRGPGRLRNTAETGSQPA